MKVTYHTAASITVEVDGIKILCDPWFYPGAFYGSWYHYPPFDFEPSEFDDIDYIYISHAHKDHLCSKSLAALNKKIPVLIHKFRSPFLKKMIERLGFNPIEIEHGEHYKLTNKSHFRVFSSQDSTNSVAEAKQTAIDTYCVISDGENTFVNTNDNFIENIETEIKKIKKQYGKIDFLASVYTSASCYPQTTLSLSEDDLKKEINRVTKWCYDRAATLIKTLNPRYYMPFAGSYLLAGSLAHLNNKRVNTSPYEAKKYFEENYPYMLKDNQCVVMNKGVTFNITTGKQSKKYVHYCEKEKNEYIENVLSKVKFEYQTKDIIENPLEKIKKMLPECYNRMEKHRERIGYSTNTKIFIKLIDDHYIFISMNGTGCEIVQKAFVSINGDVPQIMQKDILSLHDEYVILDLDLRLLIDILNGPRFAHWDDADTGSHISYWKKPNIHEKGIYHMICFFHK